MITALSYQVLWNTFMAKHWCYNLYIHV